MNGVLEYYHCPPGYCQCNRVDDDSYTCNSIYYYDDDDRQCVCDREGVDMHDYIKYSVCSIYVQYVLLFKKISD